MHADNNQLIKKAIVMLVKCPNLLTKPSFAFVQRNRHQDYWDVCWPGLSIKCKLCFHTRFSIEFFSMALLLICVAWTYYKYA